MESETNEQNLVALVEKLTRENEQLRQGYMSLSQRLIGLRMLQHISQELATELDVDKLLQRILHAAINAVDGVAGAVILVDRSCEELVFAVVEGGGGQALQGRRIGLEQGIAGWVVRNRQSLIVNDVSQDDRHDDEVSVAVDFPVYSMICAPLITKGEVIGAVQVLNKAHGRQFDDDDLDLLTTFAAQSATALENARLYQELKRERDRLISVEADIRRRLARDLHDGPAQLLTALLANIEFIQRLWHREPERVPEELANLVPLAHKVLRQVRTLLFDLRPVILETRGLIPALESYVQRQQETNGLSYHLTIHNFEGRLVPHAERAIFGIIQEAVGNVRKHAQAQNVWISLRRQGGDLVVEVQDDGRGFDVAQTNARYDESGSLGMLNMKERAEVIGGQLSVHSQPGSGTIISLIVPLEPLLQEEEDQSRNSTTSPSCRT